MECLELKNGISYRNEYFKIFFGNKNFTEEEIGKFAEQKPVKYMKQVHGNLLLETTDSPSCECDGLTTTQKNVFLAIKTADCLPIVIVHPNRIFALHCGWRGLVNSLISKALDFEKDLSCAYAFIGPHIQKQSFEVGPEVTKEILRFLNQNSFEYDPHKLILSHKSNDKDYIHLEYLASLQLLALGIPKENLYSTKVDTLTDLNWHSFRREASAAGRNIHLVLKS